MMNFIKVVTILTILSACTNCAVTKDPDVNFFFWAVVVVLVIFFLLCLIARKEDKDNEKKRRIFLLVFDFMPKGGILSKPEIEIVKNRLNSLEEEFKTATGEEAILKKEKWQTAWEIAKEFLPR